MSNEYFYLANLRLLRGTKRAKQLSLEIGRASFCTLIREDMCFVVLFV